MTGSNSSCIRVSITGDMTLLKPTLATYREYLNYSLKRVGSKYPLVVLYTDSFPAEGHIALDTRGIMKRHVPYLLPSVRKDFSNDVRFYDCWSKLAPFSLVEYKGVVQLHSDMMIIQNMDDHACICNPLHKAHYPKDWAPANCAYTLQHFNPEDAQTNGVPTTGLGIPNRGLQVVNPSQAIYDKIIGRIKIASSVLGYDFADQSLLSNLFYGRRVALPYVYNALKTLRWKGDHDAIWQDENVKNIHYILSPNPWDEYENPHKGSMGAKQYQDVSHSWWWTLNRERSKEERGLGIVHRF
ncbi:glycosyl transferase family protein [Aspergillus avenaceus]|uniref:Glycosyl transferase family protein n=1 Tax=Aspergillus avenaceus TaxID=36643 RepID=A0A5N6TN01_ASPAV|nr:glycosyl transferase family protein [Aspergillus avenaceus]